MKSWLKACPELKFGHVLDQYSDMDDDDDFIYSDSIHATILQYVTFRFSYFVDGQERRSLGDRWVNRPYLESFTPSKTGSEDNYEPLFEHPIAFRTFATFPPIKSMTLFMGMHGLPKVRNKLGVTIADICKSILDG